jgi:hypothetical protein
MARTRGIAASSTNPGHEKLCLGIQRTNAQDSFKVGFGRGHIIVVAGPVGCFPVVANDLPKRGLLPPSPGTQAQHNGDHNQKHKQSKRGPAGILADDGEQAGKNQEHDFAPIKSIHPENYKNAPRTKFQIPSELKSG